MSTVETVWQKAGSLHLVGQIGLSLPVGRPARGFYRQLAIQMGTVTSAWQAPSGKYRKFHDKLVGRVKFFATRQLGELGSYCQLTGFLQRKLEGLQNIFPRQPGNKSRARENFPRL